MTILDRCLHQLPAAVEMRARCFVAQLLRLAPQTDGSTFQAEGEGAMDEVLLVLLASPIH
eukprot:9952926-Alexandrium_andersonii.AAC.1